MNYKKLNKNIKKIWVIYLIIFSLSFMILLLLIKIYFAKYLKNYYGLYNILMLVILISCILITIIFPHINYLRYKYIIRLNTLEICKGIVFKKIIIIPFNKVQNVIIKENPINKIFNLQTIKIFTTSKNYLISGLEKNEINKIHNYINKNFNI